MKITKLMSMRINHSPGNETMEYCYNNNIELNNELISAAALSVILFIARQILLPKNIIVTAIFASIVIAVLAFVSNWMHYVSVMVSSQNKKLAIMRDREQQEARIAKLRKTCIITIKDIIKIKHENNNYEERIIKAFYDEEAEAKTEHSLNILLDYLQSTLRSEQNIREASNLRVYILDNMKFLEELCKHNHIFNTDVAEYLREFKDFYNKNLYKLVELKAMKKSLDEAIRWAKDKIEAKEEAAGREWRAEQARKQREERERNQRQQYQQRQQYSQAPPRRDDHEMTLIKALMILNLDPRLRDFEVVKKQWRKLMIENHPDKHPGQKAFEEKTKEINGAYEYLKDALA